MSTLVTIILLLFIHKLTTFVFNLIGGCEDAIAHPHLARLVMWPVKFVVLGQLSQNLGRFLRVSPSIVPVTVNR